MKCRISAFLILLTVVVAATAQEQKLKAEQIIEKHLAAIGGREALAKLKTRVATGMVRKEDEPGVQFALMSEAPNRVSAVYLFRDYDLRLVYDGKSARIAPSFARQYAQLTSKYEEIIGSGALFNQMSLYNLLVSPEIREAKFEAAGTKKVDGKLAYVVQVKPKKGSAMKLYFDAETFMWVRTDYGRTSVSRGLRETGGSTGALNQVDAQGGSEATIDFYVETSDFRQVDGLMLPFKFEQVMTSPILRQKSIGTITGTIREYQHNIAIDPKMFQ